MDDNKLSARRRTPPRDTDEFIDFSKHLEADEAFPSARNEGTPRSAGRSGRFASVANSNVAHIKRINDQVINICDEEAAQNAELLPTFVQLDLSRIINSVLTQLNLQPTNERAQENAWNPQSESIQTLKSTVEIQSKLIAELGKKIEIFSAYNSELVQYNQKLVHERKIAYETRDELHSLLLKERSEKKVDPIKGNHSRQRTFFEQLEIIDKAYESFQTMTNQIVPKQDGPNQDTVDLVKVSVELPELPIKFETDYGAIEYAGAMISIRKDLEPPTSLQVSFVAQEQNIERNRVNPYANVRRKLPRKIDLNNYHLAEFQTIVNRVNKFVGELSSTSIKESKELLECKTIEEFNYLIQHRLQDLKDSFSKCLDVLADEQRNSKHWRLRAEKLQTKLVNLESVHNNTLKEREILAAGAKNAGKADSKLPVLEKPKDKGLNDTERGKKAYISKASIYVPSIMK